jgi:serine/threonine-protein kinase
MQPERFGRYEVIRELGRGAMGRVFLAHDPEIDRKVAVKTVQVFAALPEHEREDARERFMREARSAGKLLHPGIVTLFDVGEADGALYLAMEYVEGTTVDHYCQVDHLLPVGRAVELVASAAEALSYAHEAGIVHRDIKPANLMQVGESAVKIMDFGLAKPSEGQLTRDGALLGTPSYMSPEQIRGETLDGRSDLFSLGVVLFELLAGERPFPGDSISSIIYRIVNEDPRDPAQFGDRIPAPLAGFLRRALAKLPDDRFSTGREFADELRAAAGGLAPGDDRGAAAAAAGIDTVPEEALPPRERARPAKSSALPWILVILVVVIGLGAAGWYFRDELGLFPSGPPPVTWLEAQVRAEPAEARITLDDVPLEAEQAGLVRFRPDLPPGTLRAEFQCRTAEHELLPTDAGSEVVLVLDPVLLDWTLDPGVQAASATLNDGEALNLPGDLQLDLCDENVLRVEAPGFHPTELRIPAGATPLEARRLLGALSLREIPRGILVMPSSRTNLVFYVDGERIGKDVEELELPEGRHKLRAKNDTLWIDVTQSFEVEGGERVAPELKLPPLTTLVVQAFPANCKVFLRRPGGSWKYVDDTPARRRIAVGRYDVRVKLNPTGETRDQTIDLGPGENPPVRVAFGRN